MNAEMLMLAAGLSLSLFTGPALGDDSGAQDAAGRAAAPTAVISEAEEAPVVSELSDADNADRSMSARLGKLRAELEALPGMQRARVGVALLVDGRDELLLGNRPDYPLMSVVKLPLAMAVLDRLEREGRSLDERVPFAASELATDTWSPMREAYPKGSEELTLRDLLLYALRQSDNNATDLLFARVVSPRGVMEYLRGLGLTEQSIVFTEREMGDEPLRCLQNTMSPRCAALLMERLVSASVLRAPSRAFLIEALAGCQTGQNRIAAGLKGVPVEAMGHKTGTGPVLPGRGLIGYNDVAFVRLANGHRYVLAILVKDSQMAPAETEALMSSISACVARSLSVL